MSDQYVVEVTEGRDVYACVGPCTNEKDACAWIDKARRTLEDIPMRAQRFVLHDPEETLRELIAEVEE